MHPILFDFFGTPIPSWHVLFVLAIVISYFFGLKLLSLKAPHLQKHVPSFFICIYISGLLSSRIFSMLVEEGHLNFSLFFEKFSLTSYGAFLGAVISGWIFLKLKRLPVLLFSDILCLSLLLGISIGRIGCFLNGDDYGITYSQEDAPFWAVVFPYHFNPVPRFPVQLLESIYCFMGSMGLFTIYKRLSLKDGVLLCLSLSFYGFGRFFIEYLRGDHRGWIIEGVLSPAQGISLGLILFSLSLATIRGLVHRPTTSKDLIK